MNVCVLVRDKQLEAADGGAPLRNRRLRAVLDGVAGCVDTELQVFYAARLRLKQQIVRLQEHVSAFDNGAGKALHVEARDGDGESTTVVFQQAPVISRPVVVALPHVDTAT